MVITEYSAPKPYSNYSGSFFLVTLDHSIRLVFGLGAGDIQQVPRELQARACDLFFLFLFS